MDSDPGILCVQHCGPRVFCFQIPEHCPVCRTNLLNHHPPLTPFRVPYPFVRAQQQPCAVIIKPTNGDFLKCNHGYSDYKMSMDLHIGVTDSRGRVVEYDQHGLRCDQRDSWQQCLVVSQLCTEDAHTHRCNHGYSDYKMSMDLHIGVTDSRGQVVEYDQHGLRCDQRDSWQQCLVVSQLSTEEWTHNWDQTLESVAGQDCWTSLRYHEETFNCYTFVMSFLRCLRDGTLSEAAASKVKFCEAFVSPRTTTACKYIALYRRLKDSGYYVCRPQPTT